MATHMETRFVFSQPRPTPKRGVPALPSFGVPFYLCIYRLTQNYLISRDNIYGEGLVFRWSATPPPQGDVVPALPSFGGLILCLRISFVAELPNLTL